MTGVAKLVLALFFDSRYLTGRHFEERGSGIRWAIRALKCSSSRKEAPVARDANVLRCRRESAPLPPR